MKLFLMVFAAVCILQRILETKLHPKTKGKKTAVWTTGLMGFAHAVCFVGAPLEGWIEERVFGGGWFAAGLLLFSASFFLRRWLIQTLGAYWSVYVEIREDHPLITTGPFRYCRHPNYLSILMEVFGYCFIFQAWQTLALTLLLYIPGLFFRIRIEEREMIKHFGASYERYIQAVPALLPLGQGMNRI